MNILKTLDADKEIYLAAHYGEQIVVTPDGEQQQGWVVLDDELWEEIGYIEGYVGTLSD